MVGDGATPTDLAVLPHRANYVLERGVWKVSCRVCGWEATDPVRRQLASRFRFHLRPDMVPRPDIAG